MSGLALAAVGLLLAGLAVLIVVLMPKDAQKASTGEWRW
jgi:uncharacterized membrane protein YsdA (DUF1294 family)